VKNFNWNQSQLKGFASVVLFGDATDARQMLWVDDATVTPGPRAGCPGVAAAAPATARSSRCCAAGPVEPHALRHWKNGPGQAKTISHRSAPRSQAGPRYKAAGSTSTSDCERPHRRSNCRALRSGHAGDLRL